MVVNYFAYEYHAARLGATPKRVKTHEIVGSAAARLDESDMAHQIGAPAQRLH
jgi:hypothetical protein